MDPFINFQYDNYDDTNDSDISVDFSNITIDVNIKQNTIPSSQNVTQNNIPFDTLTSEFYRVTRKRKLDPITQVEINDEHAFIFPYKWDPYTGERSGVDSNGPLYFDPDVLIKYFYTNRLRKLWVKPIEDRTGAYEGYYDDGVGAGADFHLVGRGHHPEWYLFRLPIMDCYLTKDHNQQYITFGPTLQINEIIEIEKKAELRPNNYRKMFGKQRPSLTKMRELYDIAIAVEPPIEIDNKNDYNSEQLMEMYAKKNRMAIDELVGMDNG